MDRGFHITRIIKVLIALGSIFVMVVILSMSISISKHTVHERSVTEPTRPAPYYVEEIEEDDDITLGGTDEGMTPAISLKEMEEETDPDHKDEEPKTVRDKYLKEVVEHWKEVYNMNDIE